MIKIEQFQKTIWDFYHQYGREFAWRNIEDPYKILISEVMLQQTQTERVKEKYEQFIAAFPSWEFLADASLKDVLSVWQGLGYNRRGKYLHDCAKKIMHEYNGVLPNNPELLVALPGIGKATAASICAFAFNEPTVFIETNIRAVFIHFFFADKDGVHDRDIEKLVAQAVDKENSREWYYALMDYGVMLKKNLKNPNRKSIHHTIQSKFEGSDRQIRGKLIRVLSDSKNIKKSEVITLLKEPAERVEKIITGLVRDGLIVNRSSTLSIAE